MRVISGSARGAKLICPSTARPTADRVKEGIFSSVQAYIPGAKCLDACAGSGALGIEALSRGAEHCVFVEQDRKTCETIRENLRHTRLFEKGALAIQGVQDFCVRTTDKYDLIFFDPPYGKYTDTLSALGELLSTAGQLVFETDEKLPPMSGNLHHEKTYRYGSTFVHRYSRLTDI